MVEDVKCYTAEKAYLLASSKRAYWHLIIAETTSE
jgi:hypothetical protein